MFTARDIVHTPHRSSTRHSISARRTAPMNAAALIVALMISGSIPLANAAAPSKRTDAAARTPSNADVTATALGMMGLKAGTVVNLTIAAQPEKPLTAVVPIADQAMTIDLQPYSARAAGYQLLTQIADGSYVSVDPGPDPSVRGSVRGLPGSIVAGSVLEDGLYLTIQLPSRERYWVEPITNRVPGAKAGDHMVYNGRDVIPNGGTCGTLGAEGGGEVGGVAGGGVAGTPKGVCVTQLAADADFEYYQDYGSSVTNVQNRINTVINAMNVQYETEVGITHSITTILVRTAEPDPYSSTDAGTLLSQVRNQWNAAHGSIVRDVVQLFTGKNIDGSTIGIAQISTVCSLSNAYSLVQSDCCGGLACTTDLSAHELGHTWSAQHCSCPAYTMNPSITCVNTFDPVATIPMIIAFRDSRTCLDCVPFCGEAGQLAKATASDSAANDHLGQSIAVFSGTGGDRMVVGSPLDNIGTTADAGSAYVFRKSGSSTSWVQEQKLTASDLAATDNFGTAVAMDGDYLVIGSPLDDRTGGTNAGSAYVYLRSGTTWTQQAKLSASDAAANDEFGHSVAISGDRVIVGAWKDDNTGGTDAGAAYVFRRSGTTWTQEAKLTASDFAASDQFGASVGISDVYAIVGSNLDDITAGANAGSAYIYIRSGTTWTQQAKLTASDAAANDQYGSAVSISGNYAVVGSPMDDTTAGVDAGSAYVYLRSGTTWPQQIKLVAVTEPGAGHHFGTSVSNTPDYVMVGAPDSTLFGVAGGGAYLFLRGGTAWTELARISGGDTASNDDFGISVSVGTAFAVAGSPLDNLGSTADAGSAYVFARPGPDCNANGIPDECDITSGTSGDCNSNGKPDECDIAAGTSSDINSNGIPDECEPDCNGTGTPNSYDIATGAAQDCNGNGVPDSCDITNRTSADCNGDGVPDECQDALVSLTSPQYSPFGDGVSRSYTITSPLHAAGNVTLTFACSADIGFASENVAVNLNGTLVGTVYDSGGKADCAKPPLADQLTISAATWNAAIAANPATITMIPSAGVSSSICPAGSFISVTVGYTAIAPLDANGNGVIDSCDTTPPIVGDLNGDGHVNGLDLALLLGSWTGVTAYSPCPRFAPADLNHDCKVNGLDLALLLGNWG